MSVSRDPIFVVGRQHSGNTMLTAILSRHPAVHGFLNEDRFFEHVHELRPPLSDADLGELSEILADASLPPLSADERGRIRTFLDQEARKGGRGVPAVSLYKAAKSWMARQHGAERWVQKATSYVFHTEDLLNAIPGARLVFMLRNPLDIATSLLIRRSSSLWLRMCIGWRKGVREAQRVAKEHPDHFFIVRYEDLVQRPTSKVDEIFRFCGLEFKDDFLLVDRINPAEKPFERSGDQKGISNEKVYYFRDHLSAQEKSFVTSMVGRELVLSHYPELADHVASPSEGIVSSRLRYIVAGLGHMAGDLIRRAAHNPRVTVSRFWRRIRT